MCGWESKSGWVLYGVSSEAVEKMLEVATEFFSLPVAEELKLYTRMTHQRQWDFLQVLMRTRKRFTIGGTILDFNVVLWTNMCLSGLPIPLISSKYFSSLCLSINFYIALCLFSIHGHQGATHRSSLYKLAGKLCQARIRPAPAILSLCLWWCSCHWLWFRG